MMTKNEFFKIENLLKQISTKRYEAYKEAEDRGENFNIFQVLNLDTKEVILHTPFLFELLSPNGTHGYGNTFLLIFLEILRRKFPFKEINFEEIRVKKDKYIGEINEYYTEGGIIDILIESKNLTIVIENKTSKGGNIDQKGQLVRYKNYIGEKGILFYLTLNGAIASEFSAGNLKNNQDYFCLSYKKDILLWLELCLEKIDDKPILSATIIQYSILLKKITRVINNQKMNEDIINLLTENYHEAELIKKNWDEVLKSLRRQIANGVKRHLVEEHKIPKEIIFVIHKTKRGWPNVYIQGNNWGEFLKVYLQSKELMSSGFEIGLVRNESNRMDKGDLLNKLPNLIKCKKSGVRDWICKGEKIDVNKSSLSNIENFVETISLKMKGLYDTVEKDWK